MKVDLLLNRAWSGIVPDLGGAPTAFEATACMSQAFLRPRGIRNAVDLRRLQLVYCLDKAGIAHDYCVGKGQRPRRYLQPGYPESPAPLWWLLTMLIGQLLAETTATPAKGREVA